MTTGNKENTRHCIEAGVVSGFDCVLSCKNNEVLICALDGITKMCETVSAIPGGLEALATEIEETGCLDKIEELQQNENEVRIRFFCCLILPTFQEVYQKALHIVDTYFFAEDYDEHAQTDGQGYYQFNAQENASAPAFQF